MTNKLCQNASDLHYNDAIDIIRNFNYLAFLVIQDG